LKADKKVAKYFNSPESALYHKGDVLYGIDLARAEIGKADRVFLVEGYTDVMAMHQAGVENVVASSGTALTEGQIRLLRRFTHNITVLFDGDAAGIRASLRGIDMLLAAGMNVRVALFPDGDDPDSYSKKVSSDELQRYVNEDSQDFLAFKIDLLSADIGDDPIRRAGMIHSVVESVAAIPDTIQRGVYLQSSAERLGMTEEILAREVEKALHKKLLEAQKAEERRRRQAERSVRPGPIAPRPPAGPPPDIESEPFGPAVEGSQWGGAVRARPSEVFEWVAERPGGSRSPGSQGQNERTNE
jgi:DNA primase